MHRSTVGDVMTAGACSAAVNVVGIGTFTCDVGPHHAADLHEATLPGDKWAAVLWAEDAATIAPPGSRRPRP